MAKDDTLRGDGVGRRGDLGGRVGVPWDPDDAVEDADDGGEGSAVDFGVAAAELLRSKGGGALRTVWSSLKTIVLVQSLKVVS